MTAGRAEVRFFGPQPAHNHWAIYGCFQRMSCVFSVCLQRTQILRSTGLGPADHVVGPGANHHHSVGGNDKGITHRWEVLKAPLLGPAKAAAPKFPNNLRPIGGSTYNRRSTKDFSDFA